MNKCIILVFCGDRVWLIGDYDGIADIFTEDEAAREVDKRIKLRPQDRFQVVTLAP